jgi:hypothetical protein
MRGFAGAVVALLLVAASGCGARASSASRPNPSPVETQRGPIGSGRSISEAVQACHALSPRTDYAYIASYRCLDGAVPLGGDLSRGQAARLGNVGAGPDGHIVDLYEIPCATPVRVFVDAYHCPAGVEADVDPNHLTRPQLAGIASMIHGIASDVTSERAFQVRRELLEWLLATPQVSVTVCTDLAQFFPASDGHAYMPELAIAMAAAVIDDGRDPVDGVAVTVAAIIEVLVYYQAILAHEGPSAADPQMDSLVQSARDGSLASRVSFVMSGCDTSHMGVHF